MYQFKHRDPLIFIRTQLENTWDEGDVESALKLSQMIDASMMECDAAEMLQKQRA